MSCFNIYTVKQEVLGGNCNLANFIDPNAINAKLDYKCHCDTSKIGKSRWHVDVGFCTI